MTDLMPKMIEVSRPTPRSKTLDFRSMVPERVSRSGSLGKVAPGMRIAVGVGSRWISNLAEVVKAVLQALKDKGANPFIVPAMGSHGGATPDGQEKVLAQYGVTVEAMGVPFETSMEVVTIGKRPDGGEVVFSTAAAEAHGIVVINRVKPIQIFAASWGAVCRRCWRLDLGSMWGLSTRIEPQAVLGTSP